MTHQQTLAALIWIGVIVLLVVAIIYVGRTLSMIATALTNIRRRLEEHDSNFDVSWNRIDAGMDRIEELHRRLDARLVSDSRIVPPVVTAPKTGPTSFERVLKDDPEDPV
jgi:hypothetical protein